MSSNERAYFIAKRKIKQARQENTQSENFTAYLQSKNLSAKTIEIYTHKSDLFKNWLHTNKDKFPEQAQKKDLLAYLKYLQERNLSGKTRTHRLGILRHYYTFLRQIGHIENNPTTLIKLRGTKRKKLPQVLSPEEMDELLDTYYQLKVRQAKQGKTNNLGRFQSGKHIHQRNYLMLSLYVDQGLNRSELLMLSLDDINLQKAIVNVKGQHKSNARILPLQAMQMGILYTYLNEARPLFKSDNSFLINSNPELNKLAKAIRKLYPKFTNFQQLRASAITHWIKTVGLRKAQYKAGHRYISSTEEYLANDLESLQDDINKFHPL